MTKSFLKASDEVPDDQDVLFGRGNFAKFHPGNFRFRKLVDEHRSAWRAAKNPHKKFKRKCIAKFIIHEMAPGKFVKFDQCTRVWKEVTFEQALQKTHKALRELTDDGDEEQKKNDVRTKEPDIVEV